MSELRRMEGPFALATGTVTVTVTELLHGLFHDEQPWVRHQDHFYRCWIAEVDGLLPAELLLAWRDSVSAVLGLPLLPEVRVTAQRMGPGDGSDRHTDSPAAGFEAARLIVQLDDRDDGCFRAFDGDRVWIDRPPRAGQAVAMALSPASQHDVTPCEGTRRTVVAHFWHPANPPNARARLDELLGGLSFADLPEDPLIQRAEAELCDDVTLRAGLVALLAQARGYDVLEAYAQALREEPTAEQRLVNLHLDGFDHRLSQDAP